MRTHRSYSGREGVKQVILMVEKKGLNRLCQRSYSGREGVKQVILMVEKKGLKQVMSAELQWERRG